MQSINLNKHLILEKIQYLNCDEINVSVSGKSLFTVRANWILLNTQLYISLMKMLLPNRIAVLTPITFVSLIFVNVLPIKYVLLLNKIYLRFAFALAKHSVKAVLSSVTPSPTAPKFSGSKNGKL